MSEATTTTISSVTAYAHRDAKRLVKIEQLNAAMETIKGERDAARAESARLTTENSQLKVTADTGASQKRVKELEQQLRARDHRSAFDKAAKVAGISDDKLDAAWKLSDHKADGEPTDEAITATLDGLKTSSGFLFAAPTKDDGSPPPKPAPGSGNGGSPQRKPTGDIIIPEDDQRWSDPVWQMNNQDKIIAHYTERKARGEI